MRIGIFLQFDTHYRSVAEVTVPVLSDYCHRHGYTLDVLQSPPIHRTIIQDRILRLRAAMPEYDWVAHFDVDLLVTNHTIKLESFLEKHVVVCEARTEDLQVLLVDGIMLVKNSVEGFNFLNRVGEKGRSPIHELQDAFANEPEFRDTIKVLPQSAFSSFPYHLYGQPETTEGNWKPGDFILHIPQRNNEIRVALFKKHMRDIVYD